MGTRPKCQVGESLKQGDRGLFEDIIQACNTNNLRTIII